MNCFKKCALTSLLLLSVFMSCNKSYKVAQTTVPTPLTGEWRLYDCTIVNNEEGKPCKSADLQTLNFSNLWLGADGHWSVPGGTSGSWNTDGDNLFITFENGARILLKITNTDSASLEMEQPYNKKGQLAGGTIYYVFSKPEVR